METVLTPQAAAICKGPPSLTTARRQFVNKAAIWPSVVCPAALCTRPPPTGGAGRPGRTKSAHRTFSFGSPISIISEDDFSTILSTKSAYFAAGQRLYLAASPQLAPPPVTMAMHACPPDRRGLPF